MLQPNPDWVVRNLMPEVLENLARWYPQAPLPTTPFALNNLELGCGVWGCAYDLGSVIFKVTTSKSETKWAKAQLADPHTDASIGAVRVFAVKDIPVEPFDWHGRTNAFVTAIWREKADAVGSLYDHMPMGDVLVDTLLNIHEDRLLEEANGYNAYSIELSPGTLHTLESISAQAVSAFPMLEDNGEEMVDAILEEASDVVPKWEMPGAALALDTFVLRAMSRHSHFRDLENVLRTMAYFTATGMPLVDVHAGNMGILPRTGTWAIVDPELWLG